MRHAARDRRLFEDPLQDDVRGGRGVRAHDDLELEQTCDLAECSSRLGHARDRLAVTTGRELTCQLPAATLPGTVDDQSAPPSRHRRRPETPTEPDEAPSATPESTADPDAPDTGGVDLTGLSVAGITRRRVGWASAGLVAAWIVILFARQVGDAQTASAQAAQLATDNAALADEVDALQNELDLIVRPQYVGLEARAHRFGSPREIPFSLDPSVAAPVDGAPGSTSVRLGAAKDRQTPLESWLSLLFGPAG